MSYELLLKQVEADEALKLSKQENNMPAPTKDVKVESNENVEVTNEEEPGSEPSDETKTSNENDTDVKPEPSETSKEVKKSELTEKQKQEYAFRKQFGIQEKKHKAEMESLRKSIEELKKLQEGKAPEVTRDNFDTQEEYETYRDDVRTQKILEKLQKERETEYEATRFAEEKRAEVSTKIKTIFEAPEDLKLYNEMVTHAVSEGLDDYLKNEDKNQTIKSFIDNSPIGPRVLQHLIGFPDKMKEIYNMSDVTDKKVELKLLERELQYDMSMKKKNISSDETKVKAPILGKLGTLGSGNTNVKLSKAEEDKWALDFIRGR